MPWAGGNYTKGNNGTGGWTGDASLGIGIEGGRHDTQDNDFATGINQCLNKDGSNAATGDLNLGGFRPVNVAAGTAAAPAICAGNDTNTGMYSAAADNLGFSTAGIGRLWIDNAGNIGAGTASPLTRISVVGAGVAGGVSDSGSKLATLRVSDTGGSTNSGGAVEFGAGYGAYTQSYFSAIKGLLSDGTANTRGDLAFYTRNATGDSSLTERYRVQADGDVVIGVSGAPFSPSGRLAIVKNATAAIDAYINAAGLGVPGIRVLKFDNDTTTSNTFITFFINAGGAPSGSITANGANQATFTSTSDERVKENIVALPSQLTNIMALRPVEFDYKNGSGHQVGFIAQEVQAIYPDLVGEGSDGFYTLSGLGKNEARMIKAFQEFAQLTQGTIAALEARIDDLTDRVMALEV